ncbi:MAG: ABC transporter C-terminal domain-containing protein [Planctomycetota bacterium]|nr:ABC transporter C-terminal domain-containing protein [Planctomycetota bacterium]
MIYLDGEGNARGWPGDMSGLLESLRGVRGQRPKKQKASRARAPRPQKRTYAEQIEFDAMPDKIAALEAEIEVLDSKLADPAVYARPDVKAITARRKAATAELENLYARWEELEAKGG